MFPLIFRLTSKSVTILIFVSFTSFYLSIFMVSGFNITMVQTTTIDLLVILAFMALFRYTDVSFVYVCV